MRKIFKRFLPHHDAVHDNRWLRPFSDTLLHPRLWHLNRHSAAGGIAVGLFCGLIPGPFQMLGAAICCIVLRVNLPLALVTTLYTNPFTIVPLYWLAFELGRLVLGSASGTFVNPPEFSFGNLAAWLDAMGHWVLGLGKPLGVGLVLLAFLLASLGYAIVRAGWRYYLVRTWHARCRERKRPPSPAP